MDIFGGLFGKQKNKKKERENEIVKEKKQKQEQKYDYSGTKIANGSKIVEYKKFDEACEKMKNNEKKEEIETEIKENEVIVKEENSEEKREEVNETSKENVEKIAKTEQRETETKSEAKNNENSEKMFEEIKTLNEKIANLNDMFLKKIQSMEFEKNVVNDLHKELQGYKDDLYFKLIKPTLMDLIDMKNSFKRGIENFSQKTEAEKINFLETFIFEIDTILEKNDIEIYETDITNEQNFDVKKQKIVEKIETDKKENHGKVFKVKSNGYIYKGKVISPEKVEVYVYNEKAKEELKGE